MNDAAPTRSRLLAILAADAAGYSRLMSLDDIGTLAALDSARAVFGQHVASHEGHVIDMAGDSVLAVFETATAAVKAALAIQRQLAEATAAVPDERRLRFRIGVHVGDVIEKADGTVYGDGVNIAARLQSIAEPGGVTVSQAVQGMVAQRVDAQFDDIGEQVVKNIAHPVRAFALRHRASDKATPETSAQRVVAPPAHLRRPTWMVAALAGTVVIAITVAVIAWQPWNPAGTTGALVAGSAAPSKDAASSSASVAVLPFANLSPEKGDEYFADGISEELLNVLAKIPGLRVSARTASFQFKGKDTSAREIGRQLGVGYVVEGGVRKAGSQVRITAQLVKVADGFQVWSETFNRDLKDIFAVQDEIAVRVARVLQLRIRDGEKFAAGATRNPAAYEAFLRGRETYRGDEKSAREAMRLLQQAVALDPDFALAHGKLAEFHVGIANAGLEPRDQAYPLARASAERALALDERTVQAHQALAEYAFHYAWDWDESDRHMRQALAIDPNYYSALTHLASHEMARGRLDSALDATRKAEERNPLVDTTGSQTVLIIMKRYDEAIRLARQELADHPGSKDSLDTLGIALFQDGQREEGMRILEERATANPGSPYHLAVLGWAYGRAGQVIKARDVLQRLTDMGKTRRVSPVWVASVYSGLDDREAAFAQLDRAYEHRDPGMPMLGPFWTFDTIRDDPRFRSLLSRMKLDVYFPESTIR